MSFDINIDDHLSEVLEDFDDAIERALERIGLQAESFAKANCPVDTGALRNSITHQVQGNDAYIGTNQKYAAYVEFGTGKYAETGGRQSPWVYQDEKGNWHRTSGMKARPFLRPAATEHKKEYVAIVEDELKK